MMEKGERLLVVQGGMEEWYARSSLFVLFLCWFDGLWSKVFDLGKDQQCGVQVGLGLGGFFREILGVSILLSPWISWHIILLKIGFFMSHTTSSLGPTSDLVQILKQYGQPLSWTFFYLLGVVLDVQHFLGRILGLQTSILRPIFQEINLATILHSFNFFPTWIAQQDFQSFELLMARKTSQHGPP